jgi:hypothetical protein
MRQLCTRKGLVILTERQRAVEIVRMSVNRGSWIDPRAGNVLSKVV